MSIGTLLLGCGDKDLEPENVCKLLYNSRESITFEYNDKNQLIQSSNNYGQVKYTYDKNGFLTQKTGIEGNIIKYFYTSGLLTKITYPPGDYNRETVFEYNSQKKLAKRIFFYRDGTTTTNYNNGKEISFIRNENGTITQPFQYENGKVIRLTHGDRSYSIVEYDNKGRKIRFTDYDNTGKVENFSTSTYQDGILPENASPENFFKGFPDEIKTINPNGLEKTAVYYKNINNTIIKDAEIISTHLLNAKGYVVSSTISRAYRNYAGSWITDNPYKITYSYINCEE